MTEIGRRLGRNKSTVSRELKRNGSRDGSYTPWRETSLYLYRRNSSVRKPCPGDAKPPAYVRERLGDKYRRAPEAITARWKTEHPDAKLSCNTLYRAVKRGVLKKEFPAKIYLRRGGRPRNRHNSATIKPDHTIHERPACIENRERLGDLEGDTIYSGAGGKGGALTLADRKSKFLYATLVKSRDSGDMLEAFKRALGDTPVNSFTFDNGSEFALHREISARHNAPVYFADPHSPWQRGTNENMNGLIRFFFPKGTDFSKVTEEELQRVVSLINNRPRKCLGWLSPIEFLARLRCT
jgi:IS30 family transposase